VIAVKQGDRVAVGDADYAALENISPDA